MKISKTMLWTTIGTIAAGGVGVFLRAIHRCRERVFEEKFLQQELDVLEGEGGICLG